MQNQRGIRGLAGRARGFVAQRPRAQKVTAVGGLALLATAPFGGLQAEPPAPPTALVAGKTAHLGPLDVTVEKVVTVGDLGEVVKKNKAGDRLLAVVAKVHNPDTQPHTPLLVADVLHVDGGGHLDQPGLPGDPKPVAFLMDDGTDGTFDPVNPGDTREIAFLYDQPAGWKQQDVTVKLTGYVWVTHDPLTLGNEQWWTPPGPPETEAAERFAGRFHVKVNP